MLNTLIKFLFICTFAPPLFGNGKEIDEILKNSLSNECILQTRKIQIPDYPNAYNPSLIPYQDGYLLSFRYATRFPKQIAPEARKDASFVGLLKLNANFEIVENSVQLLNIISHSPKASLTAEDGRLIQVKERIFLFFNDLPYGLVGGGCSMYFCELIEEKGLFSLKNPAKPLHYSKAICVEKNWSPFLWGDRLFLIYSDQPRVILEADLNTGCCYEVARGPSICNWPFGQIRGGTPAIELEDHFLTFFHSSFCARGAKRRTYVMGAYTFAKEPLFLIEAITPNPLGNTIDYTEENSSRVIFPGGLVIEEDVIHVAWGKGDRRVLITTFDREKLLASLKKLSY